MHAYMSRPEILKLHGIDFAKMKNQEEALKLADEFIGRKSLDSGDASCRLGKRLFPVCCLLFAVCCLLFVVCCLLFVVCCLLFAVCCLLFVCLLVVGGWLLFVVCCLLFVVSQLLPSLFPPSDLYPRRSILIDCLLSPRSARCFTTSTKMV